MRKLLLLMLLVSVTVFGAVQRSFDTWQSYGSGPDSSQYSSLKQINKSNVTQLQMAWSYPIGGGALTFGPLVVGRTMFVVKSGAVVALDAATGQERWTHQGAPAKGMNYWESKDGRDKRLVYVAGGNLTAINAVTGETITSFGKNGLVDPTAGSDRPVGRPGGNPGRIYENTIILALSGGANYAPGTTPGDIRAFDVVTGEHKWTFHSIPRPGEFGADSWPAEYLPTAGGVHNWSEMTVDAENGIVFIPFGTARFDFYGGNRKGNNLFANSLVALDAKTGKRLWHFQTIHHDLWDYDLPNSPKLLTVRHDGRDVDVVAQATKHGFLFVFNRKTGEPLWPIEERPVPQSDVPGEWSSPTQPVPTKPPAFARQSFTERDINPHIPAAEQQVLREAFKGWRNEGLFTPPSLRGSVQMPGHNGGTNWGRSAVDPQNGMMYIVSNEQPTLMTLIPPGGARGGGVGGGAGPCPAPANAPPRGGGAARAGAPGGGAPGAPGRGAGRAGPPAAPPAPAADAGPEFTRYTSPVVFMFSQSTGLELIGPPWSRLTAYDLNKGTIAWQVPHGEVTALARQGKTGLGSQNPRGGVVVTAGGLVLAGTSSDRKFRAYDKDNGKVLWELELPAASEGIPAVYEVDGRQYLAIATGGNGYITQPCLASEPPIPPPGPSEYRVYALPRK